MDQQHAGEVLRNLDLRTKRMEQLLPGLPTREEMQAAIQAAVAPLPTREEVHAAIDAAVTPLATKQELADAIAPLATKQELADAIAPLATKQELADAIAPLATKQELAGAIAPLATKQELRELRDELRGHMDVWGESLRAELRLYVEAAKAWNEQDLVRYAELKAQIRQLTGRAERSEAEIRADVERWLGPTKRSLPEILADIARLKKTEAGHHAQSMKAVGKLETRTAKLEARGRR